jgi:ribosomal protein S18 acetylase RimI-like enzyme
VPRRATARDLPDAASLAADAMRGDAWSAALYRQEFALPTSRLWVVRASGGALRGCLAARSIAGELQVMQLAVARVARRTGIASRLLSCAVADEPGLHEVTLEVRAGNVAARAFYAARGFVAVGVRKGYYGGNEDAVLMTRAV